MSGQIETKLPLSHTDERTRAKAIARVREESDPEYLLAALGLVPDPIAEAKTAAKAQAMFWGHSALKEPRPDCPVCGRQVHSHGGCNRSKACREATHGGAR